MRPIELRWLERKRAAKARFDRAQSALESRVNRALAGIAWDAGNEESCQMVRDATMTAIIEFMDQYEDRFGAALMYSYLCSDDPNEVDRMIVGLEPPAGGHDGLH